MSFTRRGLKARGFEGFRTLHELASNPDPLPRDYGLYVILRELGSRPAFLLKSPAGRFQGKNPSYAISRLKEKWVTGAHVIYIGKAGPAIGRTIRQRVGEFLRFGHGAAIAHRGGRAIWHIPNIWSARVAWKVCTEHELPPVEERALLCEFHSIFGKLPFANFRR